MIIAMLVLAALFLGLISFALSANANINIYKDQVLKVLPVAGSKHIYRNAFVGLNPAGYAKPFEPGDLFVGIADGEADNSASTTDGAINVTVITQGDPEVTITSVAVKDVGKPAYATADNTVALTGHPDAYMGRVMARTGTNLACVRLKAPGEVAPNGQGSIVLELTGHETFTATGATAGSAYLNGFELKSILGTGWVLNDAEDGGIKADFDNTAEVALNSCRTPNDCLPVDKGLTMEVDLCVADKGDDAALDIDWGFGTALTTNSEANIDHADMAQLACFHMDGNSDNVLAQSDDATTDVAPVDTTVDNDSTTDVAKRYKIIVRPTGVVEFWVDGVRKLSTTSFAMLSTQLVGAFINMEKTSNDTTASIIFTRLRVAAGMAA